MKSLCRACLFSHLWFQVLMMAPLCLLLIGLSTLIADGQAAQQAASADNKPAGLRTLQELLARVPWDAQQQGALLAVDPAHTLRDTAAVTDPVQQFASVRAGVSAFHCALFPVGSLTVIAPTERVQVEDQPKELPNFYDGLPRDLKVKYLFATLTAEQWTHLNKDGLGLGDLNEDQRKVFQSLLPDPFRYTRIPLDEKGAVTAAREKVALSPDERQQVKLRAFRKVFIMFSVVNPPDAFTFAGSGLPGKPNGFRLVRDTERDSTALYGVSFRSIVPNKPQAGHLNPASHALDARVSLRNAQTVQDLIARASESTGVELHADMPVADLPVFSSGDQVRAGDLLQALALAVTGTYRKVDRAYILVGSLVGSGTRQCRVAAWEAEMKAKVQQLEVEITQKIIRASGRDGGINGLGFAANDAYGLTDQQLADVKKRTTNFTPTEALPPALQEYIQTEVDRYNTSIQTQQLRDDRAQFSVQLEYAFQPPHDDVLDREGSLGNLDFYRQLAEPDKEKPLPPSPLAGPLPQAPHRILFLTPERLADVQQAIVAARKLGFTDLALRTERRDLLAAAILAGRSPDGAPRIGIYAAVAPFAAADAPLQNESDAGANPLSRDLDRNLYGETAAEAWAARQKSALWPDFIKIVTQRTWYPERTLGVASAMAPLEPALTPRFRRLEALGQLAGLSGLLLYDTQPPGYAGKNEHSISFGKELQALLQQENLGFTPAFRLEFLRRESVDPVDIIPFWMHVDTDLSLPFFPGHQMPLSASTQIGARRVPSGFDGMGDKWAAFLGEKNRAAMAVLYSILHVACPRLPLYIQARADWNTDIGDGHFSPDYVEWTGPDQLPTMGMVLQANRARQPINGVQHIVMHWLSARVTFPIRDTVLRQLDFARRAQGEPDAPVSIGIDLPMMPVDRVLALLSECVTPVNTASATATSDGRR